MKYVLAASLLWCFWCQAGASDVLPDGGNRPEGANDTVRVVEIEEVVVTAIPKEHVRLRQQTLSATSFSRGEMLRQGITSVKAMSGQVPNLFIPSYGSKLTTSAYIRGVGSRINTPAIGLYVDNIPYINKNAFDFNFSDIERIDVLRGPQGTLYGRNTMGGLIRLFTKSPFSYQGTDLRLGAATYGQYEASVTHYHRASDRLAFSGGLFYHHQDGFFKNVARGGARVDNADEYGMKFRAIYLPRENTKIDFTFSYEHLKQGAYPYQYLGVAEGSEAAPELIGRVAYDSPGNYKRHLLNAGLNVEHQAASFTFNSVTGFQWLKDDMNMDQDYSPLPIFTLNQKQRTKTLSQDFVLKSRPGRRSEWVLGVNGFYQWLDTDAPVTFLSHGIGSLIEDNVNGVFEGLRQSNPRMPEMSLDITDDHFRIAGRFNTPTANGAVYWQHTYNDAIVENLSLVWGLRAEYEKVWMDYDSHANVRFDFSIPMLEKMPGMAAMAQQLKGMEAAPAFQGRMNRGGWELLKKIALKYDLNERNNVYISLSDGYRSGGYNIQMFSELVEAGLRDGMMAAVNEKSGGMVEKMAGIKGQEGSYDVQSVVAYKPERSINYEVGAHLGTADGSLHADLAAYLMNTTNQQISRFAESGLGRITTNAGKSRSYGVEVSLKAQLTRALSAFGNYGYTHAAFRRYEVGNGISYSGNRVPFVPAHTLVVGAQYVVDMPGRAWIDSVVLGADYHGVGSIYWTEDNSMRQPFYGLANARVSFHRGAAQIALWGRNLFNKDYAAFSFVSMSKAYRQQGTPFQMGVDFLWHF